MQKTKSSSSTTTIYRGQRDLHSRKENAMHRRQGDLLGIHPCVIQDLPKAFQTFQSFQTLWSFMTIQPFQAILQVPVSPGNPPHSSILQSECIFCNFYSSTGFHRKLHRVPVGQYKLQTFILQRKGDVVISVKTCECVSTRMSRWHIFQNRIISSLHLVIKSC